MTSRRLRRLPSTTVLGRRVPVAAGLRARLLGLSYLDRDEAGAGLLILRCSSVHTVGMRFALDLVPLDACGRPLAARCGVPPGRIVSDRRALAFLELPLGTLFPASSSTSAGDSDREIMATRGADIPLGVREVEVPSLSIEPMRDLIDEEDWSRLEDGLRRGEEILTGREVWNVNSTSAGGGVAEMLWSWVGHARGLGVGMRWLTIDGSPEFFTITKRLHNLLHGELGDGGELGEAERAVYERISRADAEAVLARLAPRDIVFLHDPQTAGLAPHIADTGRTVIWRCHIGADDGNGYSAAAWDFLEPYITRADACVFSRDAYVPDYCRGKMITAIVPPSIDAMAPKNQEMEPAQVRAILRHVGLLAGGDDDEEAEPAFERADGTPQRVERRCEVVSMGELPDAETPLVVQVSRWDRLKDPVGVLRGFAEVASGSADAHLILAGPGLNSVADDPDGADVLAEVEAEWRRLPEELRSRVHLACLPMQDLNENAAIVNALQRQASVVVQKSLKEGFGLTVTEAMWKGRPVVASATGGILDQIENGVTGMLLPNPLDLKAFGTATLEMLNSPERAEQIGLAAHQRVRKAFLENRHTLQYVDLLGRVLH
jgi:trehalose synthase